jgi:Cd2+/Zn2+-exporting ATPase
MIRRFLIWLQNPRQRRQALSILSGALILAGLAAGNLLGAPAAGDAFLLVAALTSGAEIALRAWNSLLNRHISIELLVTIAAAGALAIGEFWEAAAVTFLFIFGAYLEARTLSRTRQVIGELLAPTTAIVVRDGQQVEIPPHEVQPGEVVGEAGSKILLMAMVVEGHSAVDESAITGEPCPMIRSRFAGLRWNIEPERLESVRATGVGATQPGPHHPPGRRSPGGKGAHAALYRALFPLVHAVYHRPERAVLFDHT